ncbi:hypothetical protein AALP_AA3G100600 [Arabis alpina]|uniref:Uncharacterized protein n=1 Tax=Arabis alpina TaxID=50452 RepID=A0A087H881_ARAAL|nr:hypothetical protein AALP_AA3G100600 [Arabis alpina]
MASPANFRLSKPTFHFQRMSTQKPLFPPFPRDLSKSTSVKFPVIKASSSSPSNPKPSLLKTTCITLTASAALFAASSFYFSYKPTPTVTTISTEDKKQLEAESKVVEALLSQTKIKFESRKFGEAIKILNQLIEIQPNEQKWPAMKARIHAYNYEVKSAIKAFEEILVKDPDRIDAYHYLVMEYYNSKPKLTDIEKRINEAIERCKKTKEIRRFRMLIALIRVMEGNLVEAIGISDELLKDDPEDFVIYMFQGWVYALMSKKDEAAKQMKQGYCLLPENHPLRDSLLPENQPVRDNAKNNVTDWSFIVAYDEFYCHFITLKKNSIGSAFGLFGKFFVWLIG